MIRCKLNLKKCELIHIYVFDLYCVLNSIPEIINVTQFQVQKETDSNNWSDSLIMDKRELATLSISNITITQNT